MDLPGVRGDCRARRHLRPRAIPAGAGADAVVAFDTGPGNMVVDWLMHELFGGKHVETLDDDRVLRQMCDTFLHGIVNR